MRELSLHILDLIENSLRANASIIAVTIAADAEEDWLRIVVEDNGSGFAVAPEVALSPFYTTKEGKHTGLGLSLLRGAAEQAGGTLQVEKSPLGGPKIVAQFRFGHVDRAPLGDLATTLSSVVCTNPELDLWCHFHTRGRECVIRSADVAKELPAGKRCGLSVARLVADRIRNSLTELSVRA